jgi:integrase
VERALWPKQAVGLGPQFQKSLTQRRKGAKVLLSCPSRPGVLACHIIIRLRQQRHAHLEIAAHLLALLRVGVQFGSDKQVCRQLHQRHPLVGALQLLRLDLGIAHRIDRQHLYFAPQPQRAQQGAADRLGQVGLLLRRPVARQRPVPQLIDAQVEGHRLEALYHLALSLGLRRGELLALRWSDIDWDAGTLRVAQSKSDAGRRTVPLGAALVERLREHWRWQQEERRIQGMRWREHGLVFPSNVGTPIVPRNLLRHFKDALSAAGLPDVRLHDLRHTCATLLAAQGTPPALAMRILGHSQIAVTMEVYTHAQLDDMRAALDRLATKLGA